MSTGSVPLWLTGAAGEGRAMAERRAMTRNVSFVDEFTQAVADHHQDLGRFAYALCGDDGQNVPDETTTTGPAETTTASDPQQSTTTSSTPPPSSTTTPTTPPPPPTDVELVLTRQGIGPIEVGMTEAEAEAAAAGVAIEVDDSSTPGQTCTIARITGIEVWFELELPASGAPPRTGVIRTVDGWMTQEGVTIGSSTSVLDNVYGSPTRTIDHVFTGGQVRIYESGGYAYAATVVDDRVQYLQSGDPDWLDAPEQCQTENAATG